MNIQEFKVRLDNNKKEDGTLRQYEHTSFPVCYNQANTYIVFNTLPSHFTRGCPFIFPPSIPTLLYLFFVFIFLLISFQKNFADFSDAIMHMQEEVDCIM